MLRNFGDKERCGLWCTHEHQIAIGRLRKVRLVISPAGCSRQSSGAEVAVIGLGCGWNVSSHEQSTPGGLVQNPCHTVAEPSASAASVTYLLVGDPVMCDRVV